MELGFESLKSRRGFLPAYSYALVILILSSLPGSEIEKIQLYPENLFLRVILSDPFAHFFVYGLLALLMCRGFYRASRGSIPLAKVALFTIGCGFLMEVYQGILPWRSFGLDDIVWNTAGVLFVVAVIGISRGLGNYFWPQMNADKHG